MVRPGDSCAGIASEGVDDTGWLALLPPAPGLVDGRGDYANRLTSFSEGQITASFAYNGLGDRLQQTVNGVTTDYTLDIALYLSQVLSDDRHTYLYGVNRIAQQNATGTAYFLPDARGSVRQLVNASGEITLAQSFDPFGTLRLQTGRSTTSYGFAGGWTDQTGLQYLRARYYAPYQGRFFTPDSFPGFITQPATLHPYIYALNNPVLFTDPSGEIIPILGILIVAIFGGALGGLGYYGFHGLLTDPCSNGIGETRPFGVALVLAWVWPWEWLVMVDGGSVLSLASGEL